MTELARNFKDTVLRPLRCGIRGRWGKGYMFAFEWFLLFPFAVETFFFNINQFEIFRFLI